MNNHYQLYVEAVITLAETMVIKFDDAAVAMNWPVKTAYGIDAVIESDRSTWKYYQNIGGQYHFSDPMIQVTSLDTGDVIDFTTANLEIHLATRAAYGFGSRHYKELVQNHPGQELLILGILNPTPIPQAIAAQDGQILRYPAELVESNERSFIPKLQKWIYQYLDRWVNGQFAISDDLYVACYMGQLYLHLVQAIWVFRLEACKTPEAHSFHVRQYLASHGALDIYLDNMTLSQSLWFYRNILYIQRHAGKRDTFDWLVEHVMTERSLPLYDYTMVHNVKDMKRDGITDNDFLLPAIEFKRKGVNSYADATDIRKYSLDEVLLKVEPLAPGNYEYHVDHSEEMRQEFQYSKSSVSVTKMLESEVVDYNDAAVYPLKDILLNHWLGLVGKNRYLAQVIVQLPANGDAIQLTAQEAVALYIYAVHKTMESEPGTPQYAPLVYVPKYQVNRMARTVLPPLSELRAITDRRVLSDAEVLEIYESAVTVPIIVSIDAFYQFGLRAFAAADHQHTLYSEKEDYLARGDAKMTVSRLYDDDLLTLSTMQDPDVPGRGIPYQRLLTTLGLDMTSYTQKDFYNLAATIVGAATGVVGRPTNSLGQLQRAMVNLFMQLSSYSIQVITEINDSNIVAVENPAIRVSMGTSTVIENFHVYVDTVSVQVLEVDWTENQTYHIPIAKIAWPTENKFTESWESSMDITSRVRQVEAFHPIVPYQVYTGLEIRTSFDFEESVKNLTLTQRSNLVDMYSNYADSMIETTQRVVPNFVFVTNDKEIEVGLYTNVQRELDLMTYINVQKEIAGVSLYAFRKELSGWEMVGRFSELDLFEPPVTTPPPATSTMVLRDDFTGAGTLSGRSPDTLSTGPWQEDTWWLGDAGALGTIAKVQGGQLVTGADGGAHWSFGAGLPLPGNPLDVYLEARLRNNLQAGNTGFNAQMGVRRVPGSGAGVFCDFYISDATTVTATFASNGTPSRSYPDSGDFTVADSSNFVARIEARGSILQLFLDGVMVLEVTLNAPMTTGGGVWISGNPATFEYLEAGTLG